jgi:predicted dehydrogenase
METNAGNLLKIGLIGCDTSHCVRFSELLNSECPMPGLEGVRVVAAYPGGSESVDPGFVRREQFVAELRRLHVPLVESIDEIAAMSDAMMILSADGDRHLIEFQKCASVGKPVFIDKPLTIASEESRLLLEFASAAGVPVCSASALRFSPPFVALLAENAQITGIDVSGPATWINERQWFSFYGIHSAEMLFEAMGAGCDEVVAFSNETHDILVGKWKDGRIGSVRGFRDGNKIFSATLHTSSGPKILENAIQGGEAIYVPLLRKMIPFLKGGVAPVEVEQSFEVIRFIEAAKQSTISRASIKL